MISLFLPVSLIFPQGKALSPRIIFECRVSLENHSYIPVSNPCSFFSVDTRCRHRRFTLERLNAFFIYFFFYLVRLTELFPFPVHCTTSWNFFFFFTKGYQAYMYFLHLFLSFNKELFQLLNFTFSCTLIAFIKGLFFDRRVIIIVLLLASYKTHGLLLPFLCASQNNRKCNELSMAILWIYTSLCCCCRREI